MRNYILKYLNAFLIILGLFVSKSAHSAIYMVTSNADAGVNTLRQAIINANASPGADSISFNFGVPTTITLASCLPNITGQVVINGYTDPGASVGVLTIEVISPAGCNGFYFGTGSDGSTIKGIVISGGTTGIYLASSNNHTVKGNYLGTTKSGTAIAASRLQDCIHLNTSNNSTIGGTGGQIDRNILSGATQDGIRLENSLRTTIVNNYIGTDMTGNIGLGNNHHGIEGYSNSHNTRVGGTTLAEQNVISSNTNNGIYLTTCQSPIVKGNIIGMGVNGTAMLGNGGSGIDIENTANGPAQIGGLTVPERNYSSNNGSFGLVIRYANNSVIQGNWLGVDIATGLLDYGNYDAAITVTNSADVIIGGAVVGAGNLCSASGNPGPGADGISIFSTSPRPIIKGNIIGLGKDTVTSLQNYGHGIECLTCDSAIIGGTTPSERNWIASTFLIGIQLVNSPGVNVQGNYIGTEVSGLLNRGGSQLGIHVSNSNNVTVGGTVSGTRNIISGNAQSGISVDGTSVGTIIKGNIIGLGSDGVTSIPNLQMGIQVAGNTANNTVVGGPSLLERNIISANGTAASHHGITFNGGSSGHSVVNNYIGTDITGTIKKGNAGTGVDITNVNNVTVIKNLSSANGAWGIQTTNATGIKVTQNLIGTDITGSFDFGNGKEGLRFSGTSVGDTAGGIFLNANTIAYNNGLAGVLVESNGQKNTITYNSIFCNAGPGISLQGSANESVLPPTILASNANSINGTGTTNNVIHIYRNVKSDGGVKCDCEGEIYIGTTTVVGGTWSLTHNLGLTTAQAASVTATQTTVLGSTSQFTPCAIPLPVDFLYFNVTSYSNHSILISWATTSEQNNNRFEILKSEDGINFSVIGTISGKGYYNGLSNYSFIDENPSNELNYYRIQQIDNNGQSSFSKIKTFALSEGNLSIISDQKSFSIIASKVWDNTEIAYQVYSMSGGMVASGKIIAAESSALYTIPLHLSTALYIVTVVNGNDFAKQKIFISGN